MVIVRKNIFAILVVGFVLFSLWPTFYELSRMNDVRPERQFELVHNFYTDYNFYLSRIRQGIEGNLLVHEKYTSEPHAGSLFQILYLGMGLVGDYVRVPWDRPGDVYHVARVVLAFVTLALIAEFCKKSFAELTDSLSPPVNKTNFNYWQLLAFLLAVTASTWPKLVLQFDGWRFGGYLPWFTVMDSLQRITFIPHLLAGQALVIFLIWILSDKETLNRAGNWIFLGVLAFILGIIYPPGLIMVAVAAGFLFLFDHLFWPRLVVGLVSFPSLLYLALMVTIYPWKRLTEFDVLNPLAFNLWEYFLAVGPVLPLGVLGLLVALGKKEGAMRPAAAWALGFFSLFALFHFIPQQSALRFAEILPHVPLAILTAYLFFEILVFLRNLSRLRNLSKTIKTLLYSLYYLALALPVVIILLGLGVMYSSWLWQRDFTNHKLAATYPLVPSGSYVMYPLKDFIAGMTWLRGNTPRSSVVLSMQNAGNYLPVYAGNTAYYGHANTVKYEEKKPLVEAFFAGAMKPQDGRRWLVGAGISYVFFGPQEAEVANVSDLGTIYPFLHAAYQNTFVTIYTVE